MIVGFKTQTAQDIFDGILSRHARKVPMNIHAKATKLFDQINSAHVIDDLKSPPGNRLERLKGNLSGKWSMRINNQWRIIFEWKKNQAFNVDIVDYH